MCFSRTGFRQIKKILTLLLLFCVTAAKADEKQCLTEALYFEARNQGVLGMIAVGVVIQNRVLHPDYPSTICGVVRQGRYANGSPVKYGCQFTYWCDGKPEDPDDEESWELAEGIAFNLLTSKIDIVGIEGATHYHTDSVNPEWSILLDKLSKIGKHIFYAKQISCN